jgi:hypothetical protein
MTSGPLFLYFFYVRATFEEAAEFSHAEEYREYTLTGNTVELG